MDHDNIDQVVSYFDDGTEIWVSLCSCGAAFWDEDSQKAYDKWEQHEADNY